MRKVIKNEILKNTSYDRLESLLNDINELSVKYKTLLDIIPLVENINTEFVNKLNIVYNIHDTNILCQSDFDDLFTDDSSPFQFRWIIESISNREPEFTSELSFKVTNCVQIASYASMVSLVLWQHFGLSFNITLKLIKRLNHSNFHDNNYVGMDVLKPIITMWNMIKLFIRLTSSDFDSLILNESPIENDTYYKLAQVYSSSSLLTSWSRVNALKSFNHSK